MIFSLLLVLTCTYPIYIESCSFKIDVYYHIWSENCKTLIGTQFGASINVLKKVADVTLIPFGFIAPRVENGSHVFECGSDDCFEGKVHACILNMYTRDQALEAIICLEQRRSLKTCDRELMFDYPSVLECAKSYRGLQYLKHFADRTYSLEPPLRYWPWIVVNGVHDYQFEDDIYENTKKALCSRCLYSKPQECEDGLHPDKHRF